MTARTAGLRIDVDTLRGTRDGVPALVELLGRHDIRATFFFSVGPDNMGRNLWRLLHPSFLLKMLRSKAASLYGWDILFKGTLWPGPLIAQKTKAQIRAVAEAGHEIGFHAWDHWRWQRHLDRMTTEDIVTGMQKGIAQLEEIGCQPVCCAAAPAWMITAAGLAARDHCALRYCSDCRGDSIFYPTDNGTPRATPQIPTTLPTYDELIGQDGITPANYNERLLACFRDDGLNVLTIHAEVEGICCHDLFTNFLVQSKAKGITFCPLGDLLEHTEQLPTAKIIKKTIQGRQGGLSWQESSGDNS